MLFADVFWRTIVCVSGGGQHLDALLGVWHPACLELLDDGLDVVRHASMLGLPEVVLARQDSVRCPLIVVAWQTATAGIDEQEMLPAPRIGDVQMAESQSADRRLQSAEQVLQLAIRRGGKDSVL